MDFALPEIGEGVYEAELVGWLVQPGKTVKRGQGLMEVMTDKATMEVPSPFAGTVRALHARPGQPIKVGEVILSYEPTDASAVQAATTPAPATPVPAAQAALAAAQGQNGPVSPVPGRLPVKAAPSVRYLARKLGVDLATIRGSGPQGRILVEDLAAQVQPPANEVPPRKRPAAPAPDYGKPGTRVRLQGLRRRIAEHLTLAKRTIPHYSYVEECEVTDMVQLRQGLREAYARAGVKLTYLAFFVKAAVAALKEVPLVNASLDEQAGEIVLHDRYHVGIAVATPAGLVVPVIRDADQRDLGSLAREIERLSKDARAGKARREDLRGGTFTVTSVGNLGGLFSTPIINHPEVGILGIGRVVKRPVFDEAGRVRPAEMVYLSLSFDHRVVDGAVGAAFANVIVRELRNPARMLLPAAL